MGLDQLESLVEAIKTKVVRSLKKKGKGSGGGGGGGGGKKTYSKMEKSSSVKVEIRSRKARRLIERTLKAADHPGGTSLAP